MEATGNYNIKVSQRESLPHQPNIARTFTREHQPGSISNEFLTYIFSLSSVVSFAVPRPFTSRLNVETAEFI